MQIDGYKNALRHWLYNLAPETWDSMLAFEDAPLFLALWPVIAAGLLLLVWGLRSAYASFKGKPVRHSRSRSLAIVTLFVLFFTAIAYVATSHQDDLEYWDRKAVYAKWRAGARKQRQLPNPYTTRGQ